MLDARRLFENLHDGQVIRRADLDALVRAHLVSLPDWHRVRPKLDGDDAEVQVRVDAEGRVRLDPLRHADVLATDADNAAYLLPDTTSVLRFDPEIDPYRLP
jgi:hypothetical protein